MEAVPRKGLILDGAGKIKSIKKRIALHRMKMQAQADIPKAAPYEERKFFCKLNKGGLHGDNKKS